MMESGLKWAACGDGKSDLYRKEKGLKCELFRAFWRDEKSMQSVFGERDMW